MDLMTTDKLFQIMPLAKGRIPLYLGPINETLEHFAINTPERQAAFIAQIAHESRYLTSVVENLNYSAQGLLQTFNTVKITRFTLADANKFGRTLRHPANQEMIANIAYANRLGNGPASSGDGWKYRGRGPGQLTGKSNYARCGTVLEIDLVGLPELLEQPEWGTLAFGWFWTQGNVSGKDLSALADKGDIKTISRLVNGGDNGIEARIALYTRAVRVLA